MKLNSSYLIEIVEHLDSLLPVNACVGNTNTKFESTGTGFGNVLSAAVNVGLNHDASDVAVASSQLSAYVVNNKGLILVIFLRIAVYRERLRRPKADNCTE